MIKLLTDVYYVLWLIPLFIEIYCFLYPGYLFKLRTMKVYSKPVQIEIIKKNLLFLLCILLQYIMIAIGFFSSQWLICLAILIVGLVFRGKTIKSLYINTILCQLLIIFILINKYYLHIVFFN